MHLKRIELSGFKSFAKKGALEFTSPIAAIVGPNGSGKSNTAEAFRFVLGEQSMKAMRGKRGPDLIWSGNERTPRANRARVTVVFNNTDRFLDIDFEEVAIERSVYRDGANEYTINGSKVRLKDVAALLAGANIGGSGHHIISQGEADRILGASPRERRDMIEDALGLKTYQYKKVESEKKLEKTIENVKDAKGLRREIAPHLAFLQRQMEKRERAQQLTHELAEHYAVYCATEAARLDAEEQRIREARTQPTDALAAIERALKQLQTQHTTATQAEQTKPLKDIETRRHQLMEETASLERARGRIEGQIALVEKNTRAASGESHVAFGTVRTELDHIKQTLTRVAETGNTDELNAVITRIDAFLQTHADDTTGAAHDTEALAQELRDERHAIEASLQKVAEQSATLENEYTALMQTIEQERAQEREAQKELYEYREQKRERERELEALDREHAQLTQERNELAAVLEDARRVCDESSLAGAPAHEAATRTQQRERLREIERITVRLDEAGVVDEDTVKEFDETQKRDAFLEREIADLEQSRQQLLDIIAQLESEIATRFTHGLEKINGEFQTFFAMLFDGGKAKLHIVKKERATDEEGDDDADEGKEGIDIQVQLPRKKITTLDVLSGGERALTSIALIFAMSQVNPPPFIILDETDAALDEANSRKYADMVRTLSKHSQLILITHNRQTMEAAGELYGVTMGSDGISKLLSVKFDEAVQVAK